MAPRGGRYVGADDLMPFSTIIFFDKVVKKISIFSLLLNFYNIIILSKFGRVYFGCTHPLDQCRVQKPNRPAISFAVQHSAFNGPNSTVNRCFVTVTHTD